MIPTTQLVSWLVAGSIAVWLANELAGRGSLGLVVDWIVGLTGALLVVFLAPPVAWLISWAFQQGAVKPLDWRRSVETLPWWYAVPLAFIGGLLFTFIFRRLSHVRSRPSP